MGSDVLRGGISFTSGASDGSKYAVTTNTGDKPVNFVSRFDAERVANWLQNGLGSGSTETGAYTLTSGTSGTAPAVNSGATFYVPTENQWYKAAFYKGGGTSAGYWDYSTGSDTAPTAVSADETGVGSAGSTGNFANFSNGAVWNDLTGNVTTVGTNGGPSPYYTFDMSGNVSEWNDLTGAAGSSRGHRGGGWNANSLNVSSSGSSTIDPSSEFTVLGFRLARPVAVPEPSTYSMALAGLACGGCSMVCRRKRS